MDITTGSGNLLLLASLSSYVSAAADGISITGNVADSSMAHMETVEVGEIRVVVNPLPAPSGDVDASVVERDTGVPPLVLEEVAKGGATRGGVTDPLLPLEGITCGDATRESIISEPTMPTSDLDPPKSKKTTVRKEMFQSFVAVLLDIECTPLKSFNLHKVLERKDVLSELQSMKFDVGFILDWLKTTATSCIIHDGEMKLAELAMKIADTDKEIVAKSTELSILTSQKNSIMLSLLTSGGSSSMETLGSLLD
nr:hypothetical protein CFP56_05767 [Quercus suber]